MSLEAYVASEQLNMSLVRQLLPALSVTRTGWPSTPGGSGSVELLTVALRPNASVFELFPDGLRSAIGDALVSNFSHAANAPAILGFPMDRQDDTPSIEPTTGYLLRRPFNLAMMTVWPVPQQPAADVSVFPSSYALGPGDADSRRVKIVEGEARLMGAAASGHRLSVNSAICRACFVDAPDDYLPGWGDSITLAPFDPSAYSAADPDPVFEVQQRLGNLVKAIHTATPLNGEGTPIGIDDLTVATPLRQCGAVNVGIWPGSLVQTGLVAPTGILIGSEANPPLKAATTAVVNVPITVACGMSDPDLPGAAALNVVYAANLILNGIVSRQFTLTQPANGYGWLGVTVSSSLVAAQVEGRPDLMATRLDVTVTVPVATRALELPS